MTEILKPPPGIIKKRHLLVEFYRARQELTYELWAGLKMVSGRSIPFGVENVEDVSSKITFIRSEIEKNIELYLITEK